MRERIRDIDRLRHIDECIGHVMDFLQGKTFEEATWYDSCSHSDDSSWDTDSDWDSGSDSWDSGGTDWDSDW